MDLEEKLKQSSDLYKTLKEIEEFCKRIWHAPLILWFTSHDVSHSKEIIRLLGQILSPIENTPAFLDEHELFILLASAYLHDIGMQYLKVENISVDKLTSGEYEIIRKRHAEESYNIILKRVQESLRRDDFHFLKLKKNIYQLLHGFPKVMRPNFLKRHCNIFEKTLLHLLIDL